MINVFESDIVPRFLLTDKSFQIISGIPVYLKSMKNEATKMSLDMPFQFLGLVYRKVFASLIIHIKYCTAA